jgi:hypothetical protein
MRRSFWMRDPPSLHGMLQYVSTGTIYAFFLNVMM